jgi:hypothetical protein
MKEPEIKKQVYSWLKKKYPVDKYKISREKPAAELTEKGYPKYPQFDFVVRNKTNDEIVLILECKGTNEDLYGALGQCMCYHHYCQHYPFYLVIPEDFEGVVKNNPTQWELKDVRDIMAENGAKFGLISFKANRKNPRYERQFKK